MLLRAARSIEGSRKEQRTINGYREALADELAPFWEANGEAQRVIQQVLKLDDSTDPADKRRARVLYDEYIKHDTEVMAPLRREMQIALAEYMLTTPVDEYWLYKFYNVFVTLFKFKQAEYLNTYITSMYEYIPERYFRSGIGAAIYTTMNLPEDIEVGDAMLDGEVIRLDPNFKVE